MIRIVAVILLGLTLSASAQSIGGMSGLGFGVGSGSSGGVAPVACLAGAFDWSLSTGCNLVFFR
jgi:hypothetical protein